MDDISVLYLEDEELDYEYFCLYFEQLVEDYANVSVVRAESPEEACKLLKADARKFNVLLADLLFPNPGEPEGRHIYSAEVAIHEAGRHPHICIIALSKATSEISRIEEEFTRAGGHLYLDKRGIRQREYTTDEIRTRLLPMLKEKGVLPSLGGDVELKWVDGDDLKLDSVIEELGSENLERIVQAFAPECDELQPRYVAPGWSGAIVLRVDGFQGGNAEPHSQLLLKCRRDRGKLTKELLASPKAHEVDASIYVVSNLKEPIEHGGWYAFHTPFVDDARTMNEWLPDSRTSVARVRSLLEELLSGALAKRYRIGSYLDQNALELLLPNVTGKARILTSVEPLARLLEHVGAPLAGGEQAIENYLRYGQVGARTLASVKRGTFQCVCHGDLHSRNILVELANGRPRLIDPARRKERHWATDLAQLSVDLWVSVWGSKVEAYTWDVLEEWLNGYDAWVSGDDIPTTDDTRSKNAATALVWIRKNVPKLFEGKDGIDDCQFLAALATEFLKASSYLETPAPKRCFSLVAASKLLMQLERLVPAVAT